MPEIRKQTDCVAALRKALAATFNFYFCAHSYHWNVTGINFPELHKLFGDIYEDAHDAVDDLAERLRTLDEIAPRSINELVAPEDANELADAESAVDMVSDLLEENDETIEALNIACAAAIKAGKAGLANFLQDRLDKHAKWGWQLKATAE